MVTQGKDALLAVVLLATMFQMHAINVESAILQLCYFNISNIFQLKVMAKEKEKRKMKLRLYFSGYIQ